MSLVSRYFVVTGALLVMLGFVTSCKQRGPRKLSIPPIPSEPQNEDDYVASYLYAREMFPLQRELVRRDLELRTNWTLMQAQRSGNVHVRAVAQPLQFTGDDAVDMSKTYAVLLIADDIPSDKKFLDVYDVTVGPNPLAAVVRDAMSAKSLEGADLAFIQENITRLVIDEGNLKAKVAGADQTRKLLGPKIDEAISFTIREIQQTQSKLNITNEERRKLKEKLPGILNRVDDAESAHKKARKRHKQLKRQKLLSQGRDLATAALNSDIAGLVQAQGFSDTRKANEIVAEITRESEKVGLDDEEKKKLDKELEEARTARDTLKTAIREYHTAEIVVEAAIAKAKELSQAETKAKSEAESRETVAKAASHLKKQWDEKVEDEETALKKLGEEALKILESQEDAETPNLRVLKKAKDDADAAVKQAQEELDDAKDDKKPALVQKLDKLKKAAEQPTSDYDTKMNPVVEEAIKLLKSQIDAETPNLLVLKKAKDDADAAVKLTKEELDRAEDDKKPALVQKLDKLKKDAGESTSDHDTKKKEVEKKDAKHNELLAYLAQKKVVEEAKEEQTKAGEDADAKKDLATKAREAATNARTAYDDAKKAVPDRKNELAEQRLKWEEADTAMQGFGSPEQQAAAADERLATAEKMAEKQNRKRVLSEEIPQIFGLRDTHAVKKAADAAEADLKKADQELEKVGRELQRYSRGGFFKMMEQRKAIEKAEEDLEKLDTERLRLEQEKRKPELTRIAAETNRVLRQFWETMLDRAKKLVGDENYEYAMRTAVMVRFRPQALKNLEQVQIDVAKKRTAGEINDESSVASLEGTTSAGQGASAGAPVDTKLDLTSADLPIKMEFWIGQLNRRHKELEAEFEKQKSVCEGLLTNTERDICLKKLDNAETGVRDARKALAKAKNAAEAFRQVTESATHAIKTVEDGLKKIRVTLMMRDSDVDPQSRLDYIEHVSAKIPGAIGTASEARKSVEDQAGVLMTSSKPPPDLSGLFNESGNSSAAVKTILGAIHDKDVGAKKSKEVIAKIDELVPKLAAYRTWVEGLLSVFNAYNPVKSQTGSFALMAKGDLVVFRFNVLRGIVSTTAYLLPSDGVRYLYGEEFNKHFYVAKVTLHNPNDKPILVYGNTITMVVRMNSADPNFMGEDGHPRRRSWWATYRPLNYKAVAAMIVSIQDRDWRSRISQGMDWASLFGAVGSAFTSDIDYNRSVAVFSGMFAPAAKEMLMADLMRYQQNFNEFGLQAIEEIEAGAAITRQIFLPKGPIYGDFYYDIEIANTVGQSNEFGYDRGRLAERFGERALIPVYIHNIRREEVYVEGKRILVSDPLSSGGVR